MYYGYRFYLTEPDRWTTRDPLGEAGGVNLYAFVGKNPVNWVDPCGPAVGHHYVPHAVYKKFGFSQEALHVFSKHTTGPIPGGHGWSKAHADYSKAVEKLLRAHLKKTGINPAEMTKEQAKALVDMVKRSRAKAIANFLGPIMNAIRGGSTLICPVIIINPCLFQMWSPGCPANPLNTLSPDA